MFCGFGFGLIPECGPCNLDGQNRRDEWWDGQVGPCGLGGPGGPGGPGGQGGQDHQPR